MIVRGCEVLVETAVTGKARRPSPKSPLSGVGSGGSYVGSLVEYVLVVCTGFFPIRNYILLIRYIMTYI